MCPRRPTRIRRNARAKYVPLLFWGLMDRQVRRTRHASKYSRLQDDMLAGFCAGGCCCAALAVALCSIPVIASSNQSLSMSSKWARRSYQFSVKRPEGSVGVLYEVLSLSVQPVLETLLWCDVRGYVDAILQAHCRFGLVHRRIYRASNAGRTVR